MLRIETGDLRSEFGQKRRVAIAGGGGLLGRRACLRLSAGLAAVRPAFLLSRDGAEMRNLRNEHRWLVLPGPAAEHPRHSGSSIFS